MPAVSVYIHIPFCVSKCRYCSFNSYAGLAHLHEPYVEALHKEMALYERTMGRLEVSTIYLGGGTPTAMDLELVASILEACREHFHPSEDVEISIEANPGTVSAGYLSALIEFGVNRLSLGAQSFTDDMLALLGRPHSAGETTEAYHLGRQAGFGDINLDLIYSLPTQTFDCWKTDLLAAIALEPEHLSLYCLSIEEGTPLARMISLGELSLPDADLAADMYCWAEDTLSESGYDHYELSNWARTGHECRHNLTYWRNEPYLGMGAGAHSFYGGRRYHNASRPEEYVKLTAEQEDCVESGEEIDAATEMSETMIMGLRLCEGVPFEEFERRFGRPLLEVYSNEVRDLVSQGLLDVNARRVRLTPRGRLLGNEVFEAFLPPQHR